MTQKPIPLPTVLVAKAAAPRPTQVTYKFSADSRDILRLTGDEESVTLSFPAGRDCRDLWLPRNVVRLARLALPFAKVPSKQGTKVLDTRTLTAKQIRAGARLSAVLAGPAVADALASAGAPPRNEVTVNLNNLGSRSNRETYVGAVTSDALDLLRLDVVLGGSHGAITVFTNRQADQSATGNEAAATEIFIERGPLLPWGDQITTFLAKYHADAVVARVDAGTLQVKVADFSHQIAAESHFAGRQAVGLS